MAKNANPGGGCRRWGLIGALALLLLVIIGLGLLNGLMVDLPYYDYTPVIDQTSVIETTQNVNLTEQVAPTNEVVVTFGASATPTPRPTDTPPMTPTNTPQGVQLTPTANGRYELSRSQDTVSRNETVEIRLVITSDQKIELVALIDDTNIVQSIRDLGITLPSDPIREIDPSLAMTPTATPFQRDDLTVYDTMGARLTALSVNSYEVVAAQDDEVQTGINRYVWRWFVTGKPDATFGNNRRLILLVYVPLGDENYPLLEYEFNLPVVDDRSAMQLAVEGIQSFVTESAAFLAALPVLFTSLLAFLAWLRRRRPKTIKGPVIRPDIGESSDD